MNPKVIAAIIRKYGQPVPSGGYELYITDEMVISIPLGSVIREYRDQARGRTVLRLGESPRVIDIKATQVDEPESIHPVKVTPEPTPPSPHIDETA